MLVQYISQILTGYCCQKRQFHCHNRSTVHYFKSCKFSDMECCAVVAFFSVCILVFPFFSCALYCSIPNTVNIFFLSEEAINNSEVTNKTTANPREMEREVYNRVKTKVSVFLCTHLMF